MQRPCVCKRIAADPETAAAETVRIARFRRKKHGVKRRLPYRRHRHASTPPCPLPRRLADPPQMRKQCFRQEHPVRQHAGNADRCGVPELPPGVELIISVKIGIANAAENVPLVIYPILPKLSDLFARRFRSSIPDTRSGSFPTLLERPQQLPERAMKKPEPLGTKGSCFVRLYHCRFLNPRLKNVMCKSEFLALIQLFSNFFDGHFQKPPIGRMKNRYSKILIFPLASRSYPRLPPPKGQLRPD